MPTEDGRLKESVLSETVGSIWRYIGELWKKDEEYKNLFHYV